jgi:hypothetical protein
MADPTRYTLPELTSGASVQDADLFISRQGTDTEDKKITASQIRDYLSSTFVPYTGATADVDLDTFNLSAKSILIEGTGGNGHLHLKHQSADATATGSSTVLFANSAGDLKYKNDGAFYTTFVTSANTADRAYTFPDTSAFLVHSEDSVSIKVQPETALSATVSFTATTAPSGATNHRVSYVRVGNTVFFNIWLNYAVAGSAVTVVTLTNIFGTGAGQLPVPATVNGFSGASVLSFRGVGSVHTTQTSTTIGAVNIFVRRNSGNTALEMFTPAFNSGAWRFFMFQGQYNV